MGIELDRLLTLLKRPESAVRFACRVGSRVYGTDGPSSDHDYLVVLADPGAKQDLLFADRINVVVHGARTFESALAEGGVFAFEAVFAPAAHVLKAARPPFAVRVDKKKLFESASSRSKSDFDKARKTFDEEPEARPPSFRDSERLPSWPYTATLGRSRARGCRVAFHGRGPTQPKEDNRGARDDRGEEDLARGGRLLRRGSLPTRRGGTKSLPP